MSDLAPSAASPADGAHADVDVRRGGVADTYSRSHPRKETTIGREAVHSFDPAALVRLRRARQLSHDALAELVASARPTLIAYEKGGRTPGPAALHRLAAALGVDALDLTSSTLEAATLADLRARVGLSKTEISVRLGIRRHTYDRIERGVRALEESAAEALAGALEVPPSAVMAAYERGRASAKEHPRDPAVSTPEPT
jgi:transcriptional regulator with XRE-family HTH domain